MCTVSYMARLSRSCEHRLARRTTSHRRSCQASTMRLDTLIPKTLNPETLKP